MQLLDRTGSSGDRHDFRFLTTTGDEMCVEWGRARPPSLSASARNSPGVESYPWRVTYTYRGAVVATRWYPASLDPASVDAWLHMHATIEAYQPPETPLPPRRSLLYHLCEGLMSWYGHGT